MKYIPHTKEIVDEHDVELCMELARMYDTEDLTHPPFRRDDNSNDDNKEEDNG